MPFIAYQKEFRPYNISKGEFSISQKQYKAIRAKRDSTIAIIRNDSNRFDNFSLMIIIDLNAVELLPDLIEKVNSLSVDYYPCIEKGKDWTPFHPIGDTSKYETDWPCYYNTNTVGNILATITAILNQEAYAPYMNSWVRKSTTGIPIKKKNVDMVLGWANDYLKNTPENIKKEAYKRMAPLF
jgi:hypothetical protein